VVTIEYYVENNIFLCRDVSTGVAPAKGETFVNPYTMKFYEVIQKEFWPTRGLIKIYSKPFE